VDAIAAKDGRSALISLKWQQTGGTAEQKVPFEVMCLADAVRAGQAERAYLVLGGDGWTLRDYYVSGQMAEHLIHAQLVRVVTLEAFVRLAKQRPALIPPSRRSSVPQFPNSPVSPVPQFPSSPVPQFPSSPVPQLPNYPCNPKRVISFRGSGGRLWLGDGCDSVVAAGLAMGVVAWATPAHAQNGSISGRVVDSERRSLSRDKKPLAGHQNPTDFMICLGGAQVTIESKDTPGKKTTVITDLDGLWYKSGLAPGKYDITVRLEWRDPDTSRTVNNKPVVFIGSALDVELKPGDKLKLPDIHALTEEAIAAGRRPPTTASAPPPGMSNAAIDAANRRAAELILC
jgi:hypothetical protein